MRPILREALFVLALAATLVGGSFTTGLVGGHVRLGWLLVAAGAAVMLFQRAPRDEQPSTATWWLAHLMWAVVAYGALVGCVLLTLDLALASLTAWPGVYWKYIWGVSGLAGLAIGVTTGRKEQRLAGRR